MAIHAGCMSSFTELFTGREDRARVLTEIVGSELARCGSTLIAHVERSTHEVLAVRSIPTPEPVGDGVAEPVGGLYPLSRRLCAVATDMVPRRQWTGDRWGPITGELLTVVCRDGDAAISAKEEQFFWGWRYSNHLTAAFHGDVYVVTPSGWAGLLGEWSGPTPALPVPVDRADPPVGGTRQQPILLEPAPTHHAGSAVPDAEDDLAGNPATPARSSSTGTTSVSSTGFLP